jgi:hypothetical protein
VGGGGTLNKNLTLVTINKLSVSVSLERNQNFNPTPGNTDLVGRLSTVDLLIKFTCFVNKVNNIFNIKRI